MDNKVLLLCTSLTSAAICILAFTFSSCSSDDWEPREVPADYKPVFKEGKTWTYGSQIVQAGSDLGESSYTYTISGDTVIKGKNYWKLYCSDAWTYGDTEHSPFPAT